MLKEDILKKTTDYVKSTLEKEGSGHDWYHIQRVVRNAIKIAKEEKADLFVVELAALLHDIADWKSHEEHEGPARARVWLTGLGVSEEVMRHVCEIIENISFKGKDATKIMKSAEGKVVQDADRLDAIGAIGIARCFTYSGSKGKLIYDPHMPASHDNYMEKSKGSGGTAINHFYEKLLLLKDLMNTPAGRRIAEQRHKFMEDYLTQFFSEWDN